MQLDAATMSVPTGRFIHEEWPYEPRFRRVNGWRMHYVDEGSGDPVVLLHGNPAWGFLYRKFVKPLTAGGRRVIVPDMIGFGLSEKPVREQAHSLDGREGDRQAPEGFYEITPEQINPLSHEYLSFNVGFPNVFDRSLGRTGSFIMVHGGCRSIGCYAMTDEQMDEIYGLVAEAFRGGQDKVQFHYFPFRMTGANVALHANSPDAQFWSMLKEGSDAFEKVGHPPIVTVCNQHYVFNVAATDHEFRSNVFLSCDYCCFKANHRRHGGEGVNGSLHRTLGCSADLAKAVC